MRLLIVASDKGGHFVPFIEEQIQALIDNGVVSAADIIRFPVRGKGALGYLRELPRLKACIDGGQPTLIHAHYGLCGLLANLQRRVPVITTYHGSDINDAKVRPLSRIAIALSSRNIFVSRATMQKAVGNRDKETRSVLIPCGVNLTDDQLTPKDQARKLLALPQDQKIILFAGAFDNAVKDPELAKAAVAALRQQFPDAPAVVLKELKGYTRHEVNLLLCAADCLLLTSRMEGSPQIVKEAMACGCPVVSVDVGDVRERIAGLPSCHVAPSRTPQSLAPLLADVMQLSEQKDNEAPRREPTNAEMKTAMRRRLCDMSLTNPQVAKRLRSLYLPLAVYRSLKTAARSGIC